MNKRARKAPPEPTGLAGIDRLSDLNPCTIQDYIQGASTYVRSQSSLTGGLKKASQIRLSNALARALAYEIEQRLPNLKGRIVTTEQKVAGSLRTANADVSESHSLDGLRLAVELKPINLAVGRALWNRFGDIRTFAVNIHLKFPFAVVGGVLVIPTYEEKGSTVANEAEEAETDEAEGEGAENNEGEDSSPPSHRRPTLHLIERAIERLIRAGGRKSEADASHLLEGIAVVVYDPDTGHIVEDIPKVDSGLRWEEFVDDLVSSYRARFED